MLVFGVYPFITFLVGGWANPSEKYVPQIGSLPPVFGAKIQKKMKAPPRCSIENNVSARLDPLDAFSSSRRNPVSCFTLLVDPILDPTCVRFNTMPVGKKTICRYTETSHTSILEVNDHFSISYIPKNLIWLAGKATIWVDVISYSICTEVIQPAPGGWCDLVSPNLPKVFHISPNRTLGLSWKQQEKWLTLLIKVPDMFGVVFGGYHVIMKS